MCWHIIACNCGCVYVCFYFHTQDCININIGHSYLVKVTSHSNKQCAKSLITCSCTCTSRYTVAIKSSGEVMKFDRTLYQYLVCKVSLLKTSTPQGHPLWGCQGHSKVVRPNLTHFYDGKNVCLTDSVKSFLVCGTCVHYGQ